MTTQTPGQLINEMAPGTFLKLAKITPAGSLEARKLSTGVVNLYWRVTVAGKTLRELVGIYDSGASPKSLQPTAKGFSIMAATRAAEAMAQKHVAHLPDGGIVGVKKAEEAAKVAKQKAADLEAHQTLARLLTDYCDHLESLGRSAHKDARSIFALHVVAPWPDVASMPARNVTLEHVADMMRLVREKGRDRTANKLRSYVRSAYATALKARSSASIPVRFKAYMVSHNPAADTQPDESANRADKNPLSAEELRTYWQIIRNLPGIKGAALRLHLLTGGQRIAQLVRLKCSDIQPDSIVLTDGKGRPGKPARPHAVPLVPAARLALEALNPAGEWAISTDGGITHLAPTTLSSWAVEAVGDQIEAFNTKRIRSGVETLLASVRVSSETRGRLQSHGIMGVQARHYDGHDYMAEKLEAVETLYRLLTNTSASVVPLRKLA